MKLWELYLLGIKGENVKKLMILLILLSVVFSYWLPIDQLNKISRFTVFDSKTIDLFPNHIQYYDNLLPRGYQIDSCNRSIEVIESNFNYTIVQAGLCGINLIPKDGRFHWICDGFYLKYNYVHQNKTTISVGYLLNSFWIKDGKSSCPIRPTIKIINSGD